LLHALYTGIAANLDLDGFKKSEMENEHEQEDISDVQGFDENEYDKQRIDEAEENVDTTETANIGIVSPNRSPIHNLPSTPGKGKKNEFLHELH